MRNEALTEPNPMKGEKLGGDRFTLSIGYDFDNWGSISLPDYNSKNSGGGFRFGAKPY